MWLTLVSLLSADPGPFRCVARWEGPATGCAVRGEMVSEGTSFTEKGAARSASRALQSLLAARGEAVVAKGKILSQADFALCGDASADAHVSCFPEPELADWKLCFVSFEGGSCWTGDVLNFEGPGVRALTAGRRYMCGEVEEHVRALGWNETERRVAECTAKCQGDAQVRCTTP